MLQHKSIASKTSHTKQVKHFNHRTKAAFKYQSKTIVPSKEIPRKKAPLKSKIAKNNQMQDIEYFERLDIPDEKEDAVFK